MSSSLGHDLGKWEYTTANGRRWRLARESDLLAIGALYAEQERRLGEQDKPDLFARPVVLTLVAEDETGAVVAALYAEQIIEMTSIGLDKPSMASVSELFPELSRFLGERGFRIALVSIPKRIARLMRGFLPGLALTSDKLAHFVYSIRR